MADQLLSQADVDALVASLTRNEPAKPAAPPAPVPAPKPAAVNNHAAVPAAKPVPVRAEPKPEVSSEVVNSLNAKIADLTKQLNQMGATIKRFEALEKKVAEVEALTKNKKESEVLRQKVQLMGDELKKIALNLKGTPGYGIKNSFSCDKCSDHGHVAVMFRCTKCGHERWYGWWPEKEK